MEKKKPAYEVRLGRVRATIWENEMKHGRSYSVTVGRRYETDGNWKTSSSLDREDLLLAGKALDLADTWIREARAHKSEAEDSAEEAA